ncbi:MAG: hypothetical protein EXR60_03620 [Dehalococcoidia bacterium]|nr:hypothetical protein [Dehalococcoidia bacterium]
MELYARVLARWDHGIVYVVETAPIEDEAPEILEAAVLASGAGAAVVVQRIGGPSDLAPRSRPIERALAQRLLKEDPELMAWLIQEWGYMDDWE